MGTLCLHCLLQGQIIAFVGSQSKVDKSLAIFKIKENGENWASFCEWFIRYHGWALLDRERLLLCAQEEDCYSLYFQIFHFSLGHPT